MVFLFLVTFHSVFTEILPCKFSSTPAVKLAQLTVLKPIAVIAILVLT